MEKMDGHSDLLIKLTIDVQLEFFCCGVRNP